MKTKISIACLAVALLALGQPARAAGRAETVRFHTASFEHRHFVPRAHHPENVRDENISGVIPRVSRGSNPLQMLNPLAPAKYGTAEENALLDPDAPGKASGINFFSISF